MASPAFETRVTDLAERHCPRRVRDPATRSPAEADTRVERLARRAFAFPQACHRVLDDVDALDLPNNPDFTMMVEDVAIWPA